MTTATVPFVTSFMSLASEREGGGHAEISSVATSLISDPPITTMVVATTVVVDPSSVPVPRADNDPVHHTLFADSASIGEANQDIAGPSHPAGTEFSLILFWCHKIWIQRLFIRHIIDYDQLLVEFNVGAAHQTCLSSKEAEARVGQFRLLRGLIATVKAPCGRSGLAMLDAIYVFTVNALRAIDFPLLAQLESQKDASIVDIMGLLHLEGPAAKTLEVNQLQPLLSNLCFLFTVRRTKWLLERLLCLFSLDVVHARVQRILGDAASHRQSLSDAMVPLIEPLSAENLVGEESTSGVPGTATTTTLSTTFILTSFVPLISVADYDVLGAKPSTKVPSPPKIMFEKEELETTPEHTTTDDIK
ncbi:hypothetical protein Tco_0913939 [Tanacetum coccineum]